jgi:predicted HNH restriction endonuclease
MGIKSVSQLRRNGHIILRDRRFLYLANLYGYQCRICKATELEIYDKGLYLECHHKQPLNQGGSNHPRNCMLVCSRCHQGIHRELENYWIEPSPYQPFKYVHLHNQLGMLIL